MFFMRSFQIFAPSVDLWVILWKSVVMVYMNLKVVNGGSGCCGTWMYYQAVRLKVEVQEVEGVREVELEVEEVEAGGKGEEG